jgi:limonene-1,2-epoxide hydrolase
MKKLIFLCFVSLLILSCNQSSKKEETSSTGKDMKALYEKNLATLKTGIAAFEKKDMEAWAATISDTARWQPASYGAKEGKKEDWKKALSSYTENWDSLQLLHPRFLPGLDSATHEFDGSVRYYGQWSGVHKSGVKTVAGYYGTFDFNKDGKIIFGADYFDVGGLMNAVTPKK